MPRTCPTCGRSKHKGLCDLIELSDGRTVHASRVDGYGGDVRKEIDAGTVKVVNRWIRKRPDPKPKARRN
jgi:hypothetical protein